MRNFFDTLSNIIKMSCIKVIDQYINFKKYCKIRSHIDVDPVGM